VKQGQIGDCWLIGALSVLATRDELLRGGQADSSEKDLKSGKVGKKWPGTSLRAVYPPIFHMYRKKGIYVIRIFKDF